jgi:hypothetical protein
MQCTRDTCVSRGDPFLCILHAQQAYDRRVHSVQTGKHERQHWTIFCKDRAICLDDYPLPLFANVILYGHTRRLLYPHQSKLTMVPPLTGTQKYVFEGGGGANLMKRRLKRAFGLFKQTCRLHTQTYINIGDKTTTKTEKDKDIREIPSCRCLAPLLFPGHFRLYLVFVYRQTPCLRCFSLSFCLVLISPCLHVLLCSRNSPPLLACCGGTNHPFSAPVEEKQKGE